MQNRSKLNKTINIGIDEGRSYLDKCIKKAEDIISDEAIINGDTFKVLKELDRLNKKFDCVIVDPPYNLSKNYHGNIFNKKDVETYEEYTRKWIQLIIPLLKKDASIYVCCDWATSMIFAKILPEFFIVKNRITWQREKGRGCKVNWKNCSEDIWFCTVTNKYKFNPENVKHRRNVIAPYKIDGQPKDWVNEKEKYRDTYASNFWDDITIPFWSMPENTAHPTQKPEKLIAKLILASTDENDIVLDPFGGSGTTAAVCKKLNRKFILIEQNPQYCIWTQKRLENAEINKNIQGYADGVFHARNYKTKL